MVKIIKIIYRITEINGDTFYNVFFILLPSPKTFLFALRFKYWSESH